MKKAISFILIFLTMLLVLSSCVDNYVIDETKTMYNIDLYNDIEKIKSLQDDPNSSKSKSEFMQTFEEAAGFALPTSFVYPTSMTSFPTEATWAFAVESSFFFVNTHFISTQSEALGMLNFLKKDDSWKGYHYRADSYTGKEENNKKNCTFFKKTCGLENSSVPFEITLNFHFSEKNDCYIIWLNAFLDRKTGDGILR